MIQIWTKCSEVTAYTRLSPVLRHSLTVPLNCSDTYSIHPDTKLLIGMGKDSLEKLQEAGALPKNRTLTSQRSRLHKLNDLPFMVTYSPDIDDIDHRCFVDMLTDVSLGIRYWKTGSMEPVYGAYRYVPDFLQLIAKLRVKHEETGLPVDLVMDCETVGLDPWRKTELRHPGAYIVTIQFSMGPGTCDVIYFPSRMEEQQALHSSEFRTQMVFLLTCPWIRLRGANLKYDLTWLWVRAGLESKNFVLDTTIIGSLLDENRSNALNVHTKVYVPELGGYDDKFEHEANKDRMDREFLRSPSEFLKYSGGDGDACYQVADALRKDLLADNALTTFYVNILHPAARAFEVIERGGVFVDPDAFKELKSDLEIEAARLAQEASKVVGGRITVKHHDDTKLGGLNLTKASFIKDFMFSPMGLGLKAKMFTAKSDKENPTPSTALEHLLMFKDEPEAKEFVRIQEEYAQCMKTYSTYVVGFMSYIRSDGRLHPTYYLFVGNKDEGEGGAVTGRLSCHNPAFQTLPKRTKWAKRIRRCYPAPPGYVIVERDYSSGELRVIACMAYEDNMIAVFKAGMDLHAKTGGRAAKMTYEDVVALKTSNNDLYKEIRQKGKAGNFGLVFAMGVDGFIDYALSEYGAVFTKQEGKEFRDGFFEEYPKLLVYHATYKNYAHKHKMVRTPLGRIRHLPLIDSPFQDVRAKSERMAINSPVQGTLTDMLLWTMALEHKQEIDKEAPSFGACHDAAYNYVPEDRVDVLVPKMLNIQENLPFHLVGWTPQLQFIADASVGPTMADVKERVFARA